MTVRSQGGADVDPIEGSFVLVQEERPGVTGAELEFRQLRYFVSVAEELHFGRAASRMFISQPALSQAIAGLERTLDVQLFVRSRQNVELTSAGTELLRHARGMLADQETAVASVRRVDRGQAGVVRLGVAVLAEPEVSPAFAAMATRYPELLLDRTTAVSERLLASLANRELHAAVVHQVPVLATVEGVDWEPLRSGRLAVLMSETHDLAGRESATLPELSGETFLVGPRELAPSAFEGMQTMCRTYGGFEPQLEELSTLGADWQAVISGEAVALMADGAARASVPEGAVAVQIEPPPQALLALAWRRGNGAPQVDRFIDFIRAYRDEHGWVDEQLWAERA
jgi:DNA-binding transcriptional LysR family regulator